MMTLKVMRIKQGKESTLSEIYLNGQFMCYGLEDAVRETKVKGSTAIPAGRYRLGLNRYGAMNARYSRRFPALHNGMIEILDIPGFSYVYIHIGNHIGDTSGCLLVGTKMQFVDGDYEVSKSVKAYKRLYATLLEVMLEREVIIEVVCASVAGTGRQTLS